MKFLNIQLDKMIYEISELHNLNLSQYKINKLVDQGVLKKINRKYYENRNYDGDYNEFAYVSAYIESGVICLISAASYYHLTSVRPLEIDTAVHRNRKIRNYPEWPTIKPYYFSENRYQIGIVNINENDQCFKIYDINKTVVDIIYYREKIGIEETKQILLNYLNHKDRNLNLLYEYSKKLRCDNILKTYMEVLL